MIWLLCLIMCLVASAKKYEFIMGADGWTIMGGGSLDYLMWNVQTAIPTSSMFSTSSMYGASNMYAMSYSKSIGSSLSYSMPTSTMSRFIMGKEALVHSRSRKDTDKDLWYFQSPLITLGFRPTLLMFSMMSFAGDFQHQNDVPALVRLRFANDLSAEFPLYERYDGSAKTFYVQFIKELWRGAFDDQWYMRPFILEILGDWTCGWETIGLDNVEII